MPFIDFNKIQYDNAVVNCIAGGILIGGVAAYRQALFGKVTGISGMLSGILKLEGPFFTEDRLLRLTFISGFLVVGRYVLAVSPDAFDDWSQMPLSKLGIGAFLVGYGTVTGNGCTSGHGVCGISALRLRSLVSSIVFVGSGMLTATLLESSKQFAPFVNNFSIPNGVLISSVSFAVGGVLSIIGHGIRDHHSTVHTIFTYISEFFYGTSFATALTVANMIKPAATLAFLDLNHWYPVLALVLGSSVLVAGPSFDQINKMQKPILSTKFIRPATSAIDWKLLLGAATFGIGWGLTGSCPGPALVNLARFEPSQLVYLTGAVLGMWTAQFQEKLLSKNKTY